MLWIGGRISWIVILMAMFTTFAILLTDWAWRIISLPVSSIGALGLGLVLIGNAAILFVARQAKARSGKVDTGFP